LLQKLLDRRPVLNGFVDTWIATFGIGADRDEIAVLAVRRIQLPKTSDQLLVLR
jgi:hypothetical protein